MQTSPAGIISLLERKAPLDGLAFVNERTWGLLRVCPNLLIVLGLENVVVRIFAVSTVLAGCQIEQGARRRLLYIIVTVISRTYHI